ncbi:MAG: PEP-CTERM sorting domain-containing protein [Burkholderiales bacterium]
MKPRHFGSACISASIAACGVIPPAFAITSGRTDAFEDGTTQGWSIGAGGSGPAAPVNVPDGGPAGIGDGFLRLTSLGGAGPGSRLVAFNGAQWTGDYLAAGLTAVRMDLINLGTTDLNLGLSLNGSAYTKTFLALPAESGWRTATFSLLPADLDAGFGSAADVLASVNQLRIFHGLPTGVGLPFPGPAVVASLGVDNIAAIPEPGTWALLVAGLGITALGARRRT